MPLMLSLLSLCTQAASADRWAADLAAQHPRRPPRLECRYTDASRAAAEILAQRYEVLLHLGDDEKSQAELTRLLPGMGAMVPREALGALVLEVESGGEVFSSLRATLRALSA